MDELIIDERNAVEDTLHKFTAEASELGIKAGQRWPDMIRTTLGNRQQFLFVSREIREGDLLWATYRQVGGCIELTIFND